jgi:hypothetical protein
MNAAAAQLAARISSLLPRHATASFEYQNLTTLPAPEWSNFESRLREELDLLGVKAAGAATAGTPLEPRVRVTLADDARGLLFVAELSAGDSREVAMLPWSPAILRPTKPPVTLTQKSLWTQTEPILDILITGSGSEMLVLSPEQVASYRAMDGKWTPAAVASLLLPRPMPRDPRGRLESLGDGFRAYLPAGTCEGRLQPELTATCAGGTPTWRTEPVHWVADRNVLAGDAPGPSFEGWGSDRAIIADPCAAGTVEIASSANNEHDSVRAYQIANGQVTPMSEAMALSGPETALWPAESGREVTLVVHNLQTGEYEASRLGLACAQ